MFFPEVRETTNSVYKLASIIRRRRIEWTENPNAEYFFAPVVWIVVEESDALVSSGAPAGVDVVDGVKNVDAVSAGAEDDYSCTHVMLVGLRLESITSDYPGRGIGTFGGGNVP